MKLISIYIFCISGFTRLFLMLPMSVQAIAKLCMKNKDLSALTGNFPIQSAKIIQNVKYQNSSNFYFRFNPNTAMWIMIWIFTDTKRQVNWKVCPFGVIEIITEGEVMSFIWVDLQKKFWRDSLSFRKINGSMRKRELFWLNSQLIILM